GVGVVAHRGQGPRRRSPVVADQPDGQARRCALGIRSWPHGGCEGVPGRVWAGGGAAMTMITNDRAQPEGWGPAPGSVTRHNWPLPLRWAWWLAHRPGPVAVVVLVVLGLVRFGPVVGGAFVAG